jgi:phthalate 4,5-cis-dihydrodiol dehydrogenase
LPKAARARRQGETRRAFHAQRGDTEAHRNLGYGGRPLPLEQLHFPHFGLIVATCERGDLRLSPNGVTLHGIEGTRQLTVPTGPGRPGQGDALDALWTAIRENRRCIHDARWGRASVEAVLALLRSAQERREVTLRVQTPASEQTRGT